MDNTLLFRADSVLKADVGSNDQREDLLSQIKKSQETTPNAYSSNIGCYRNTVKYENLDWLLDVVKDTTDEFLDFYKKQDPMFEKLNVKSKNFVYWTNINTPGSRNVVHSHKSANFSCVYYVQGTDCGPLRLINPANTLSDCKQTAPFVRDAYFHPKDGDLIMWPAWVPHEVEPNLSNRERINITFDIMVDYE